MIRPVRLLVSALAVLGLMSLGSMPASAASPPGAPTYSVTTSPVTGTAPDGSTFSGTATLSRFQNQGGALWVSGTISGVLTHPDGTTQAVASTPFSAPVSVTDPSCQILTLQTGPIYLDLLGLVVNIAPINITITAQQGAGNLVGNLLCAVANLLNQQPAAITALVNLLNHILAAL